MAQQAGVNSRPTAVSRFLKGKRRDAMDEIEGWISDTKADFGRGNSSRVSAQPPKNVTEQKMLESKLFEMSKQRYNFMLHCRWQQKLFMEKQRQKTAVMKDLLKNVDLSKIQRDGTSKARRQSQFRIPSIRTDRSSKVAMSEPPKPGDDLRTLSPSTAMTGPDNYQKKSVTFITERGHLFPAHPASSIPISLVQSANEQPNYNLPQIDATRHDTPDLLDTKSVNTYIVPLKGRWPVKDERFLRLSQALSDNYHGRQRKDLPVRTMALA